MNPGLMVRLDSLCHTEKSSRAGTGTKLRKSGLGASGWSTLYLDDFTIYRW